MVIPVVKTAFVPLSAIVESPANADVTMLSGISARPAPDTATALPKQAHYTWIFNFLILWYGKGENCVS